jgi:hypothetical protein
VQKRPDTEGVRVGTSSASRSDDVLTLEEIEAVDREGREIDPRTRGADRDGSRGRDHGTVDGATPANGLVGRSGELG